MITDTILGVVRRMIVAIGAVASVGVSFAQMKDVPSEWKADCVGRMQLSLPGDVDVAATTLKDIERMWRPASSSFEDEQVSWGSGLEFLGKIKVIHGLTPDGMNAYMARRAKVRDKFRSGVEQAKKQDIPYKPVVDLPILATQAGFGFQAQGQRLLVLRLPPHVFSWGGFTGISEGESRVNYETILRGVRGRSTFDVPKENGVCLPYSFIRDDGSNGRSIAMTYRLKGHPDITIFLKDMDAAKAGPAQDPRKFTATYETQYFWTYYCSTCRSKSVKRFDIHRHTSLAGQPAIETIADLVRKDGTEDFGYLVVAKGDADAKEDTPDLMLYVMRDADNARAKGIKPMPRDEFLKMAREIAASVRRRPVHR
jgi:Tle cognate immunity protein 4 C-terminal domain